MKMESSIAARIGNGLSSQNRCQSQELWKLHHKDESDVELERLVCRGSEPTTIKILMKRMTAMNGAPTYKIVKAKRDS